MIDKLDTILHRLLDGYIHGKRPGYKTLAHIQSKVCDAFDRRYCK